MSDINNFNFTGRLTKDAVVKSTPNGKKCLEMDVANNIGYGDYKKTVWLKVKMWGDRAVNIAPIFTKGALVGGFGELSLDEWEGKDGDKHTNVVVVVNNVQLLYKKKEEQQEEQQEENTTTF